MARYLTSKLISELKTGKYSNILKCAIEDSELSLEIRTASVAMVYYKKSKILSLHSRRKEPKLLSKGYWKNEEEPFLDLQNPEVYFISAKHHVDNFTTKKKNIEFSIQQKILSDNNSDKNPFLVIDMEYQFAQNIINERTKKKTRFDLVGVDLMNDKVMLFELKQGFSSSEGNSGVSDHISKYQEHINHPEFSKLLISDIIRLIVQKGQLGIYKFDTMPIVHKLDKTSIEFSIIFAYKSNEEMDRYLNKYGKHSKTLFINTLNSNFTLREDEL
jgi:hypothetical protein